MIRRALFVATLSSIAAAQSYTPRPVALVLNSGPLTTTSMIGATTAPIIPVHPLCQVTPATTPITYAECTFGGTTTNTSSGVSSFNSRTGAVTPASGDYSFSLLSGSATLGQLPVIPYSSTYISGLPTLGTAAAQNVGYFDLAGAASNAIASPPVGLGSTSPNSVAATTLSVTGASVLGGISAPIATKTAAYTATANDYTIKCNASSGPVTVTNPPSPVTGQIINFKKIDSSSNACSLNGNGKTIDGVAMYSTTTQNTAITEQYDGTTWSII